MSLVFLASIPYKSALYVTAGFLSIADVVNEKVTVSNGLATAPRSGNWKMKIPAWVCPVPPVQFPARALFSVVLTVNPPPCEHFATCVA